MLKITIAIFQCILLLALSNVNGFKIIKFNNLDQKQMVSNVLQMIKKINSESDARNSKNIEVTGHDELKSLIHTRKNQNAKGLINKRLVKRVIPHGYEVSYMEYDSKFHTLYKPLVRIHKTASNNKNGENKYNLVFVLHEDQYKDIVSDLTKDESLLEPFAIDSRNLKDFNHRSCTNLDYYTDNNEKRKSADRLKSQQNIVDLTRELKNKNIRNEHQYDTKDNSFDTFLDSHIKIVNKDDTLEDQKTDKYKFLDLIGQLVKKQRKTKGSKMTRDSQAKQNVWFNEIGNLISKQLKRDQKQSLEKPDVQQFEHSKLKNVDDTYLNLLETLVQNKANKKNTDEIENTEAKNAKYKWFVPLGSLNSMTLNEDEGPKPKHDKIWHYYDPISQPNSKHETNHKKYDISEEIQPNTNDIKYSKITKQKDDLIRTLKKIITRQSSKSIQGKQRLFGKVRDKTGKQFEREESQSNPIKNNKNTRWQGSKDFKILQINKKEVEFEPDLSLKSDKYSLLSQIAKLKMNNLEKEKQKRLEKQQRLEKQDAFMRYGYGGKSGEDEMDHHLKKKDDDEFFWSEDATTTKKPSWKSNYPYWNYWTYEKNINQDACKGNTVQVGPVCVNRD